MLPTTCYYFYMNPKRIRIYILLVIVAAAWGFASPIIKYVLDFLTPDVFLAYRFAMSALFGVLCFLFSGRIHFPKDPKIIVWTLLYAFLSSTVQLGVLFLGYNYTSAISASLISATGPIFITLGAVYFLHEHVTKSEKLGLILAFFGTLVTIFGPIVRDGAGIGQIGGNLLIFLAIMIGVATAVIAKKLVRERLPLLPATNLIFIVGFVTMLPITLLSSGLSGSISQIASLPISVHLAVIYMALISGTLAYYFWLKAEKSIEVGEVGVFSYLQPVFATPLAIMWLGEQVTVPFIIGALIIALGVGIAEYKKTRSTKR